VAQFFATADKGAQMKSRQILICNGDRRLIQRLRNLTITLGYESSVTNDVVNYLECGTNNIPDLIILCAKQERPQECLVATTRLIKKMQPDLPVIILSQTCSEKLAIGVNMTGASDFYQIPFSTQELGKKIQRLFLIKAQSGIESTNDNPPKSDTFERKFIGKSKAIEEIKAYLLKVAHSDSTVLITGETGTGKGMVASLVHEHSIRQTKPFVCINCAALPDTLIESELFGFGKGAFTGASVAHQGKFLQAKGGTLFLDEIGDMSHFSQAKILRTIESKEVSPLGTSHVLPVDVRLIAATNQNLEGLIEEGKFRRDLYFRLNVASLHLPPLRERNEDIPELCNHFMNKLNAKFGLNIRRLTHESMDLLTNYTWPGNIRELINIIEAIYIHMLHCDDETAELPDNIKKRLKATVSCKATDMRKFIISALKDANWNKSAAARNLGISRTTLYRKIREHNIIENTNCT
jgi:DNA-binding NtrC family response regulator